MEAQRKPPKTKTNIPKRPHENAPSTFHRTKNDTKTQNIDVVAKEI